MSFDRLVTEGFRGKYKEAYARRAAEQLKISKRLYRENLIKLMQDRRLPLPKRLTATWKIETEGKSSYKRYLEFVMYDTARMSGVNRLATLKFLHGLDVLDLRDQINKITFRVLVEEV